MDLPRGHAAHLVLESADGAIVHEARVMDGDQRTTFGWLEDMDPESERIRADLGPVMAPSGVYTLRVEGPDGSSERPSRPAGRDPDRHRPADGDGTAVRATRDRGGPPAHAWAPVAVGGRARLPLGEGDWSLRVDGAPGLSGRVEPDVTGEVALHARPHTWPRVADDPRPWVVQTLLLPVTLFMLLLGGVGLARTFRRRGAGLAALAAMALAAFATVGTLVSPTDRLLMSEPGFTDPPTSASLAWATADALRDLSDLSTSFAFPEGHSWLALGPSWLAYVLAAPFAWFAGGVAAHNLGQTLCLALLGFTAWGLARARGADPGPALLASAGAVLAPSLLAELDEMSLDRAALFAVPVFVLCLDRAATQRGWRWPVAAGIALASVLYAQTYYGLYLAAAAPLLVLPRLIGASPTAGCSDSGRRSRCCRPHGPLGTAARAGLGDLYYRTIRSRRKRSRPIPHRHWTNSWPHLGL